LYRKEETSTSAPVPTEEAEAPSENPALTHSIENMRFIASLESLPAAPAFDLRDCSPDF
jgi:hypothetical protein